MCTLAAVVVVLPLIAHFAALALWVWSAAETNEIVVHGTGAGDTRQQFGWGRMDLCVMMIVALYALLAGWAMRQFATAMKLALLVYSLVIACALGEFAVRLKFPDNALRTPWPAMMHRVMNVDTNGLPGLGSHVDFTVNHLGIRGPDSALDQAEVKILCVGGSTTECMYVTDQQSWPWRLQSNLSNRLHKNVFVGNAGIAAQFSLHHEYQLRNFAMAKQFPWVVILMGVNDMGTLLRGDYSEAAEKVPYEALTGDPEFAPVSGPYYRHLKMFRMLSAMIKSRAHANAVVQDEYGDWIRTRRKQRQEQLATAARRDLPPGLDEALNRYRANILGIIDACRQNHQHPVFMTQPLLYSEKMGDYENSLLWQSSENGAYTAAILANLIDRYNRTLIEVCGHEKVDFIDLASMLPRDTSTFYDDCHFNVNGCERVSRIVADALVPILNRSQ